MDQYFLHNVALGNVAWFILRYSFGAVVENILKFLHFIHLAITQGIFNVKMLNSQNKKCTGFCRKSMWTQISIAKLRSSGHHRVTFFRKGRMNLSEASPDTFSFSQETSYPKWPKARKQAARQRLTSDTAKSRPTRQVSRGTKKREGEGTQTPAGHETAIFRSWIPRLTHTHSPRLCSAESCTLAHMWSLGGADTTNQ